MRGHQQGPRWQGQGFPRAPACRGLRQSWEPSVPGTGQATELEVLHHKHLFKPGASSCPITYSHTYDLTSSCTTHSLAPGFTPPQPPVTSQACSCPNSYTTPTTDITSTCTSHLPPSALSPLQVNMTTQAPPQVTCPSIPNQILRQQLPQKHLCKPGTCFCPTN